MLINYNSSYRFTLLDNSLSFYVKDKGDKAVGFMLLFEFSGMTSPSSWATGDEMEFQGPMEWVTWEWGVSVQRVSGRLQTVLTAFDFGRTADVSEMLQDVSLTILFIDFKMYQLFNLPQLISHSVIFVCSQFHNILSTYQLMFQIASLDIYSSFLSCLGVVPWMIDNPFIVTHVMELFYVLTNKKKN